MSTRYKPTLPTDAQINERRQFEERDQHWLDEVDRIAERDNLSWYEAEELLTEMNEAGLNSGC